jgi:hypothetical protein
MLFPGASLTERLCEPWALSILQLGHRKVKRKLQGSNKTRPGLHHLKCMSQPKDIKISPKDFLNWIVGLGQGPKNLHFFKRASWWVLQPETMLGEPQTNMDFGPNQTAQTALPSKQLVILDSGLWYKNSLLRNSSLPPHIQAITWLVSKSSTTGRGLCHSRDRVAQGCPAKPKPIVPPGGQWVPLTFRVSFCLGIAWFLPGTKPPAWLTTQVTQIATFEATGF